MSVFVENCQVQNNYRSGVKVVDFWKGAVEIYDCVICCNVDCGIQTNAHKRPDLAQHELATLERYEA